MRNITALLFVATVPDSGPERLLREQKRVAESITNTARSPSEKSVRDVTHQLLRELCHASGMIESPKSGARSDPRGGQPSSAYRGPRWNRRFGRSKSTKSLQDLSGNLRV